jgi:hypothetical protein
VTTLEKLIMFFSRDGWSIETNNGEVLAVQSSGYGSGPAVIDLVKLAEHLDGR